MDRSPFGHFGSVILGYLGSFPLVMCQFYPIVRPILVRLYAGGRLGALQGVLNGFLASRRPQREPPAPEVSKELGVFGRRAWGRMDFDSGILAGYWLNLNNILIAIIDIDWYWLDIDDLLRFAGSSSTFLAWGCCLQADGDVTSEFGVKRTLFGWYFENFWDSGP